MFFILILLSRQLHIKNIGILGIFISSGFMVAILFYFLGYCRNFRSRQRKLDIYHLWFLLALYLGKTTRRIKQHKALQLELSRQALDFAEQQLFCTLKVQHKSHI